MTASTIYQLSIKLTSDLPVGSVFTMDFSGSDIGTQTAELFSCYHQSTSVSPIVKYTSCSCDNSKKCYATVSEAMSSDAIVNLYMGNMNNPVAMKSQTVGLLVTFNTGSPTTLTETLTVTGSTYIAQTITGSTLTQASNVVLAPNKFTIVF